METGFMNRITGLVIALVVGGLLVGGLLIPSIEGMTDTETTLENTGVYYITDDEQAHTIVFEPNNLLIDNEVVNMPSTGEYTILATDKIVMRTYLGGGALQIRGNVSGNVKEGTFTIENGTINGTYIDSGDQSTKTISSEYTDFIIATNEKTDMVMKSYAGGAYLLGDSVIMGRGVVALQTPTTIYRYMQFNGTIAGGITVDDLPDFTISNVMINTTEATDYIGVSNFVSVTFDVTHNNSGTVTQVTFTAVVVPAEITAEKAQHMDATQIAMFGVISILGIVALVVVAANGIRNKY